MIKEILAAALERRFFWRNFGFTELSELYLSNLMRVFALSILMVFVPFFMYQHGYTITSIFVMYGIIFATRAVWDILSGFMVAQIGPKHTMILSCILQIISASLFLTIPSYHWSLFILGIPWGMAISLYFIAYHVAFSKVKHTNHAGKELGIMQIMEKLGGVAGPIVGGVAGTFIGSQYIFLIAAFILLASLWPLFQTSEPVRTKQVLHYTKLPLDSVKYDLTSYVALGIENSLCINTWALFVALFVLENGVYAKLGALSAAGVLVSIIAAYFIGKAVDTPIARSLLRTAAVLNGLIYLVRPFTATVWGVLGVNIANESITPGYRLPYIKGMYAAADDHPGLRIVYLSSMECLASIAKATAFTMLAICSLLVSVKGVLLVGFGVAGVASFFIMSERFRALRPKGVA